MLPMAQAYIELGALFLEHVAALRNHSGMPAAVLTLAGIMYNYTDERYIRLVDAPEFLALLRCIASLTRRYPWHQPLLPFVQACPGLNRLIKMHTYSYTDERYIQMVDALGVALPRSRAGARLNLDAGRLTASSWCIMHTASCTMHG